MCEKERPNVAKGKYKRKRMNKIRRETLIRDTTLPTKTKNILNTIGIYTLYDLDCFSEEDIENIPGIGEKYLEQIKELRKR